MRLFCLHCGTSLLDGRCPNCPPSPIYVPLTLNILEGKTLRQFTKDYEKRRKIKRSIHRSAIGILIINFTIMALLLLIDFDFSMYFLPYFIPSTISALPLVFFLLDPDGEYIASGSVYLSQGLYVRAAKRILKGIRINPENEGGWECLALLFLLDRNWDRCIEACEILSEVAGSDNGFLKLCLPKAENKIRVAFSDIKDFTIDEILDMKII